MFSQTMVRIRFTLTVVGVAVLAWAISACGTDGQTTPQTATSSLSESEQLAVDAYRNMWRAFSTAGMTSDVDNPDLARYAADEALQLLRDGLESNREQGVVSQGGEVELSPTVVSASPSANPTEVGIRDCADTSNNLRVKATPDGTPFSDSPGGRRLVDATVRQFTDGWKVVFFEVHEVGSC